MMLKSNRTLLIGSMLLTGAAAAGPAQTASAGTGAAPERSYAYVDGTLVQSVWGIGADAAEVLRYAKAHPGWYVVFSEGNSLYRLDAPARLAELRRTLAPMRELDARQHALATGQRPLADGQRALAAAQRAATTPAEMAQVGAAQGAIGREQGEVGRLQGEIGRKQGEIGQALNEQISTMADACLKDRTCKRVSPETAQR